MYGTLTDLTKAFIAVALIVVMVDVLTRVLEWIMKKIPYLPDAFEPPLAYSILTGLASGICWQGHFDLFTLLGFSWRHTWEGYLATGAIMAGGSKLLMSQFKVVGLIPGIVSGVASMFGYSGYSSTIAEIQETVTTPPSATTPTQEESSL